MASKARKAFLTTASIALLASMANAQAPTQGAPTQGAYRPFSDGPKPIELTQTPPTAYARSLSPTDSATLTSALTSARRGDITNARTAIASLSDPIARKLATWALVDAAADSLSFFEVDQARRDLAGWPRGARRQLAAEKLLETSGQSPAQIIAWFGGGEPQTAEGAMALASAWPATGRQKATLSSTSSSRSVDPATVVDSPTRRLPLTSSARASRSSWCSRFSRRSSSAVIDPYVARPASLT